MPPAPDNMLWTPTNFNAKTVHTYYEVMPKAVKVRNAPSLDADVIAHRRQGEICACDTEDKGWVRLVERFAPREQAGWMLVDGKALSLGTLLKKARRAAGRAAKRRRVAVPRCLPCRS